MLWSKRIYNNKLDRIVYIYNSTLWKRASAKSLEAEDNVHIFCFSIEQVCWISKFLSNWKCSRRYNTDACILSCSCCFYHRTFAGVITVWWLHLISGFMTIALPSPFHTAETCAWFRILEHIARANRYIYI